MIVVMDNPNNFVEKILEVRIRLKSIGLWWRGQPKLCKEWNLKPKVYRGNRGPAYEQNAIAHFLRKAPARYPDCPTDHVSWLFLMQHYGLPTRLLDWTESALIALFFAVQDTNHNSDPAVLWGLEPTRLNKYYNHEGVPVGPVDIALRLAKAAYKGNQANEEILALYPPHRDTRMLVQQASCTLHGYRKSLEELQLENSEEFLLGIKIPPEHKPSLRGILALLGMRSSNLFPDLGHLAKELEDLYVPEDHLAGRKNSVS